MNRSRPRLVPLALALVTALAAVGCSQAPAPTAKSPTAEKAPAAPAAKVEAAPAKPATPIKVKIVQGVDGVPYTPAYVNRTFEYFKAEGLDVQYSVGSGGGPEVAALAAGEIDVMFDAIPSIMTALDKGVPLQMVMNLQQGSTMSVIARTDVATKHGLDRSLPLQTRLDRIAAAARQQPLNWAVTSPNSASHLDALSFVKRMGLTDGKEIKIVTIGDFGAVSAAITNNRVELAHSLAPFDFKLYRGNYAKQLIVQGQDVPEMVIRPNIIAAVRKDWAQKNPDTLRRVLRAQVKANQWINTASVDDLVKVLTPYFPKYEASELKLTAEFIRPMVPKDGKFSPEGIRAAIDYMKAAGTVKTDLSPAAIYTNEYLP